MKYSLACYNLEMDGGDDESDEEDPRHLNIEETEGEHDQEGKHRNIGMPKVC